ncbi:hypothetical protein [Ruegeria sp. HKCCD6157]|uniref:hypothetical protein n=1 Tax=Ruegeria sp. HKCCD6157 TaxID=2690707 RepID=UPI00149151EE|nr:hypothetical protein [Ruegeria sp. HKCCD6157]NOE24899.1 hypothetical protein [Ruegeria sp. HKCCD6157]
MSLTRAGYDHTDGLVDDHAPTIKLDRQMSEELVFIQRVENAGFVLQIGFWRRRERILVSCLTTVSLILTFKYMKNICLNVGKRKNFSSDLGFRQDVYKILFQIQ